MLSYSGSNGKRFSRLHRVNMNKRIRFCGLPRVGRLGFTRSFALFGVNVELREQIRRMRMQEIKSLRKKRGF